MQWEKILSKYFCCKKKLYHLSKLGFVEHQTYPKTNPSIFMKSSDMEELADEFNIELTNSSSLVSWDKQPLQQNQGLTVMLRNINKKFKIFEKIWILAKIYPKMIEKPTFLTEISYREQFRKIIFWKFQEIKFSRKFFKILTNVHWSMDLRSKSRSMGFENSP